MCTGMLALRDFAEPLEYLNVDLPLRVLLVDVNNFATHRLIPA